jgi:hypothetical protein
MHSLHAFAVEAQVSWLTQCPGHPEQWTHVFSDAEVKEISDTADAFIASATPLTGISQDTFRLSNFAHFLGVLRKELIDGKGFILFKGLPVQEWGNHKSAVAYMVHTTPLPQLL